MAEYVLDRVRTWYETHGDGEVRLEHAVAMYRAIPDPELMVVPFEKRFRGRFVEASLRPGRRVRAPVGC